MKIVCLIAQSAKWHVQGSGSPGFSPQTVTARAAAVLPAVEKRVVGFLPVFSCSSLSHCGDLLYATVLAALGSGGTNAGLPGATGPSAVLPHRKSGKLTRGIAEAFLLDVRLTSDRHFHYKILDL